MNLIVSTCGTSTLTNLADSAVRQIINKHANEVVEANIPVSDRMRLTDLLNSAKSKLRDADAAESKKASAELNGLLSFAGDCVPLNRGDYFVLLHTDTWLGAQAAQLIEEKLKSYGAQSIQLQRVASLSTRSRESFDEGLRNLIHWAATTLPGYRDARYRIIFNLVGGFKSVQGFMQTLGMFFADEILYIFESGGELLRIPRLPIDLDAASQQVMQQNATLFRRLEILGSQPAQLVPTTLPEIMLYSFDDQTELSTWGNLIWSAFRPHFYEQQLLDPPSSRIQFTEHFRRDAEKLPPLRRRILNERIDDLLRYLESPDSSNPPNRRRLDLKKLSGSPKPPSTHEADAWADADCKRIFLHYDQNNVAILDRLDKPLH